MASLDGAAGLCTPALPRASEQVAAQFYPPFRPGPVLALEPLRLARNPAALWDSRWRLPPAYRTGAGVFARSLTSRLSGWMIPMGQHAAILQGTAAIEANICGWGFG